jgi:hypothetical protein
MFIAYGSMSATHMLLIKDYAFTDLAMIGQRLFARLICSFCMSRNANTKNEQSMAKNAKVCRG